jgi:hypothetical protein
VLYILHDVLLEGKLIVSFPLQCRTDRIAGRVANHAERYGRYDSEDASVHAAERALSVMCISPSSNPNGITQNRGFAIFGPPHGFSRVVARSKGIVAVAHAIWLAVVNLRGVLYGV